MMSLSASISPGREMPARKRHAYLRVVTSRTACHDIIGREQLIEPLLDDGLAVGTRNADNGYLKLVAMAFCKPLQGLAHIRHDEEIDFAGLRHIGHLFHDETLHSLLDEKRYVMRTVTLMGLDGEE